MSGLEKKNPLIFKASVARALINAGSLQQNRRRPSGTTPTAKCRTVTKVPSEVRFSTRNHSSKPGQTCKQMPRCCMHMEDQINLHAVTNFHMLCSPGDQEHAVNAKGCAAAPECISGSMNLGLSKTTINTKCCSTDLCNSEIPPANEGGTSVTLKGCVSRSLCTASKSSVWGKKDLRLTEMSCCKGNLCNSAAGVKLSLLIMLVPLLSSFFL
ncbi:hypothetical protein NFI96_020804 [Prochilodus magdalenae]|nr:hypothetical protein NFI96_020804 [Prochilodus magdalenae]